MGNYDLGRIIEHSSRFEKPCIVYDKRMIADNILSFAPYCSFKERIDVLFAEKANMNPSVLQFLCEAGVGIDVASTEELKRAREAGFTNINLTSPFIKAELLAGGMFEGVSIDFDNLSQLRRYCIVKGNGIDIGVRVRIPALFDGSESYGRNSRFGIDLLSEEFGQLLRDYRANLKRIHIHIGEYRSNENVKTVLEYIKGIIKQFPDVEIVNLGGGYTYLFASEERKKEFWSILSEFDDMTGCKLKYIFEPGMQFLLNAGFLLTEVLYINNVPAEEYEIITLDASAWCLFSWNPIRLIGKSPYHSSEIRNYKICGASCYEKDVFAENIETSIIQEGDTLIFGYSGAYSGSMKRNLHGFNVHEYLI